MTQHTQYCDPDGSGKSTTLKSLYDLIDAEPKKEITNLRCDEGSDENLTLFEAVPTNVTAREGFEFSFGVYEAKRRESKRMILNGMNRR